MIPNRLSFGCGCLAFLLTTGCGGDWYRASGKRLPDAAQMSAVARAVEQYAEVYPELASAARAVHVWVADDIVFVKPPLLGHHGGLFDGYRTVIIVPQYFGAYLPWLLAHELGHKLGGQRTTEPQADGVADEFKRRWDARHPEAPILRLPNAYTPYTHAISRR